MEKSSQFIQIGIHQQCGMMHGASGGLTESTAAHFEYPSVFSSRLVNHQVVTLIRPDFSTETGKSSDNTAEIPFLVRMGCA